MLARLRPARIGTAGRRCAMLELCSGAHRWKFPSTFAPPGSCQARSAGAVSCSGASGAGADPAAAQPAAIRTRRRFGYRGMPIHTWRRSRILPEHTMCYTEQFELPTVLRRTVPVLPRPLPRGQLFVRARGIHERIRSDNHCNPGAGLVVRAHEPPWTRHAAARARASALNALHFK
jgi:hypothetical protein